MAKERYTATRGNKKVTVTEAKFGWDVKVQEGKDAPTVYKDEGSGLTVLARALA